MAVYGIDLGTTYSCIARYDDSGSVEALILNSSQTPGVPSVVNFEDSGKPVVGNSAKVKLKTRPLSTKAQVKREMDKEFCAEDIVIAGKKRRISPVEVQACILKHLLKEANVLETGRGNKPITKAVITVPAQFNEQQRARTKLAAELAGIEVLGLLQEPTAAAVAYDIPAGNTVLVFDLGGGTLDVSIVTNNAGYYKTISTPTGDLNLGGVDWDAKLVDLVLKLAKRNLDPEKRKKLLNKAEEAKMNLTQSTNVDFEITEDDDPVTVERSDFENVTKKLMDKCMSVVSAAIENAKATDPNLKIDFFLTVGGSSRMPMVRKAIIKKFGPIYGLGKTEDQWLRISNPDTAIAIGAAKYAQLLSSGDVRAKEQTSALMGFANLSDISSHSYGIRVLKNGSEKVLNIVKSTDGNGTTKSFIGLKLQDNTDSFIIDVYENDLNDKYVSINEKVKKISSKECKMNSKYPKGTPVDLQINLDQNGMIHLTFICEKDTVKIDVNNAKDLIDLATKKIIESTLQLMN